MQLSGAATGGVEEPHGYVVFDVALAEEVEAGLGPRAREEFSGPARVKNSFKLRPVTLEPSSSAPARSLSAMLVTKALTSPSGRRRRRFGSRLL